MLGLMEEARHSRRSLRTLGCDARRLEPWRQVRTRGHPSRRPRHSASKTRVNALKARAPQDEVGVERFAGPEAPAFIPSARTNTACLPDRMDGGHRSRAYPRSASECAQVG